MNTLPDVELPKRENAGWLSESLRGIAPERNHPRIRFFSHDGQDLVAVGRRPGDISGAALKAEGDKTKWASKISGPVPGVSVAACPLKSDTHLVIVPRIPGPTLHDRLLERQDDDSVWFAGKVAAAIHGARRLPDVLSGSEVPIHFPITSEQWSRTPDAVFSVLAAIPDIHAPRAALQRLRSRPANRQTMIHGDFKPDNLIVDPNRVGVVRAVDWELCGLGHPADDLAAMAAGIAVCRVAAHNASGEDRSPEGMARYVELGVSETLRALEVLVAGYRTVREPDIDGCELADALAIRLMSRAQGLATVAGTLTALVRLVSGLAAGLLSAGGCAAKEFGRVLDIEERR